MSNARAGSLDDLPLDEPYPGVARRTLDGEGATLTRYDFEPGARFPVHRHSQEQITLVLEGSVHMALGDDSRDLAAGDWSVVPGEVEHGIEAGSKGARIAAIVVPRRSGMDAYEVVEQ